MDYWSIAEQAFNLFAITSEARYAEYRKGRPLLLTQYKKNQRWCQGAGPTSQGSIKTIAIILGDNSGWAGVLFFDALNILDFD